MKRQPCVSRFEFRGYWYACQKRGPHEAHSALLVDSEPGDYVRWSTDGLELFVWETIVIGGKKVKISGGGERADEPRRRAASRERVLLSASRRRQRGRA